MSQNYIIYAVLIGLGGLGLGYVLPQILQKQSDKKAKDKQKELILSAKDEALKIREEAKKEEDKKRKYLEELEKNLRRKEEQLENKAAGLERKAEETLSAQKEILRAKGETEELKKKELTTLEKLTKLKREDAKQLLLNEVEKEYKEDIISKIKKSKEEAKEEIEAQARRILSTVIQRIASDQTAEISISPIPIPSEDMKGRIIGKEGRNIQIFEKVTGVDVVIDDTPDTIMLSSFDPVRRQIAKVAMERLISDGRIHPASIEEQVEKSKKEVQKQIREAGEEAASDAGVSGLHPDLIKILGSLNFRTSYGQNVLRHSVEVANIAGLLSQELDADQNIARKAGLLHDVGKAVSHEIPGAHHHISMEIAKKYGLSETVVNAIGAHHDDIEPETVEAVLVKAADAISGSRPGSRRESLESYIKRLTELENIANSFPGVEKSYAIQAGREVRILVKPQDIDDLGALKLAKDIAQKIERNLQYPGTIKVNVIRETRATEYAK